MNIFKIKILQTVKINPPPKQREAYIACERNKIVLYGGA